MSITQSLYNYLMDPADLTGHPARKFQAAQTINGWTIANRNDARRYLRDQVGRAIYADRRPQDTNAHTAVILRTLGSDPNYDLAGADAENVHFVEVAVLAKTTDSARRCQTISKLIELSCSGYHGDYWGDTYIGECTVDRDGSDVLEPGDASDHWTHRYTMDLRITHDDVAPIYPSTPLQAVITFPLAFGEGDSFLMSAAGSVIPEGRTLADIAWQVTRDGHSTITFNGTPQIAVATANITGTYINPAITRASFTTVQAGSCNVQLTITDDDGRTSVTNSQWR